MLSMACFSTRSVERQMQELVPDGQVCSRVATSLVKYLGIVFMPTHAGYGSCFHWVSPGKKKTHRSGSLGLVTRTSDALSRSLVCFVESHSVVYLLQHSKGVHLLGSQRIVLYGSACFILQIKKPSLGGLGGCFQSDSNRCFDWWVELVVQERNVLCGVVEY